MHVVLKDQSYWIEHTTHQIYEVKEKQERFCTTHCWTHTRNDFFLRHAFLLPARHYLAPQNRNIRARGMETTIRHCLNLEHGRYRSSNRSVAFGRCLQVGDWGEKRAKKSNVNFSKQEPIIGSCPKSNKTFSAKRSPILHRVSMKYTTARENHSGKKRRDANELILSLPPVQHFL